MAQAPSIDGVLDRFDVLVVGGGVAGSATALLCARRGLRVGLVERGHARLSGPFETMVASAGAMIDRVGLGDAVRAAATSDLMRHGAIWGSDQWAWRDDGAPGLLLRRGAFDEALRAVAAAAGVERLADAGALAASATIVVDARGRAAHGGTQPSASGRRLLAVTVVGEPAAEDIGTATVEAVADGWIWTHAPSAGEAAAAVLVDGDEAATAGLSTLVGRALASALGPARRLRRPRVAYATDATPRLAPPDAGRLRIGDAAATIDPLASQGVEKALAAADHATAIVATAVERPAWRERLFAAHARWERGLWRAHGATAAAWYAREARFADHPFWRSRRTDLAPAAASPIDAPLRVAPTVRAAEILVRNGDRFVAQPGFLDAATGDEASHIGYVPIDAVLGLFAEPVGAREAVQAGGRNPRLFVLPPRAVEAAVAALVARGWLIPAGTAAESR